MRDKFHLWGQARLWAHKPLCIDREQNRLETGQAHISAEQTLLQQHSRLSMAVIGNNVKTPQKAVPA